MEIVETVLKSNDYEVMKNNCSQNQSVLTTLRLYFLYLYDYSQKQSLEMFYNVIILCRLIFSFYGFLQFHANFIIQNI